MSSNSDIIVQEVYEEFESMLHYVHHSETETAYAAERNIFKRLLLLGHKLMVLFFALQAERYPRTPVQTATGGELPYHGQKKRTYFSVFGKLPVLRPYFYKAGVGRASPLDEQLSLGADSYSDVVREIAEYLGVDSAYEKVTGLFGYLLGQSLGKNAVQLMVTEDAEDIEAFYEQKPAPDVSEEGCILVVQADGKGVPLVKQTAAAGKVRLGKGEKRSKKKESVVTSVYTIEANIRRPEEVIASLFRQERAENKMETSKKSMKPQHKEVWATLEGKDAALARLALRVAKREGGHIQERVALTDGAEALQKRVQAHLPAFTLVLDFIHANEYLWDAANRLYQEQDPQRLVWMEKRSLDLLSGRTADVIVDLRQLAQTPGTKPAQQEQLHKTANYFERNLEYMHYDDYLRQGWPIASGVIEGACRHLVKDRCERTGMRWTQTGAETLLQLRAVAVNDDWDDYHAYRREQRHLRLYDSPLPQPQPLEHQAFNATSPSIQPVFSFGTASGDSHQPATELKLAA
jgi:hypothetical protein